MPYLYGRHWSRAELEQHIGDLPQVAGIRPARLTEGRAAGVRVLSFDAGDGLAFTVVPDRCLDIAQLTYRGVPLCWQAPNGIVAPQYYEPAGFGWLRSFFGGALTTCGLRQVGAPCEDESESLGLHGRISNLPAEQVAWGERWEGDRLLLWCRGMVREARVYGEHMRLEREISVGVGETVIAIRDRITNLAETTSPFMVLYHCNVGFPLVQATSRLLLASQHTEPGAATSAEALANLARFAPPLKDYQEQVFYHHPRVRGDGYAAAAIVNDEAQIGSSRGIGFFVRWRVAELPYLVQWKMLGEQRYLCALEPANCYTEGRVRERQRGTLRFLAPGEAQEVHVELGVLPDSTAIAAFEAALPSS